MRHPIAKRRAAVAEKKDKMTFAEWAKSASGIVKTGDPLLSTREGFGD
jgi:hypothetical protein